MIKEREFNIGDQWDKAGGTFTLRGTPIKFEAGYIVSITRALAGKNKKRYTKDDIYKILGKYDIEQDNIYVGYWEHKGKTYWDINIHSTDFHDAFRTAIHNKEIAIWDCQNEKEIIVK